MSEVHLHQVGCCAWSLEHVTLKPNPQRIDVASSAPPTNTLSTPRGVSGGAAMSISRPLIYERYNLNSQVMSFHKIKSPFGVVMGC